MKKANVIQQYHPSAPRGPHWHRSQAALILLKTEGNETMTTQQTKARPITYAFPPVPRAKGEPDILWEGPCAYVIRTGECHEVIIFSSNYVTHKPAGMTEHADRAKRTCDGLNAYPRQSRTAYGLL